MDLIHSVLIIGKDLSGVLLRTRLVSLKQTSMEGGSSEFEGPSNYKRLSFSE